MGFLRSHHIYCPSCFEGLKRCFHVKMDFLIAMYANTCPDKKASILLKPICYDAINEITISQERNV